MSIVRSIRKEIAELESLKYAQNGKVTTDDIAKIIQRVKNNSSSEQVERAHVTSFYGLEDKQTIKKVINPTANYKEAFLLFDSNFKDTAKSTNQHFVWNVANTQVKQSGTIPVPSSLRNVVGMRLYPYTMTLIPPIPEADKTMVSTNVMGNYNYTIFIEEFRPQAYYGKNGRNYHFITFPYILNPNYLQNTDKPLTPPNPYVEFVTSGKGNGWFWFHKPVVEFSTITMSFGNPWSIVTIPTTTRIIIPIKFIYDYQEDTIKF